MQGFNKVIIAGNLTRDPEMRYTPSGTAVAKLGLAVNRRWKDAQTNETKEEVTFVDVDAWGKQAELISQYLKKGRPILIEGRLKLDQWEDKTTHQKQSKLKVHLESFTFLDSGGTREGGGDFSGGGSSFSGGGSPVSAPRPAARPPSAPPPSGAPSEPEGMPPEEDDVPF
jgi:single-strand DNA-binding protein